MGYRKGVYVRGRKKSRTGSRAAGKQSDKSFAIPPYRLLKMTPARETRGCFLTLDDATLQRCDKTFFFNAPFSPGPRYDEPALCAGQHACVPTATSGIAAIIVSRRKSIRSQLAPALLFSLATASIAGR